MRSTEYRFHRRAGLTCCRAYRKRVCECDRILSRGLNMPDTCRWLASRDDWLRRLTQERLLLAAQRISMDRWRSTVIAMRPRASGQLLGDLTRWPG